jgi:alginate O-acetyltransferase complex protein AlgI
MLFNSYVFILGFLPVVLAGFWVLGRRGQAPALLWLTVASLVFYAWWRPLNVLLIAPSILINFGLARLLQRWGEARPNLSRVVLIAGITGNLCFLGYFKYLVFFSGVAHDLFGTDPIVSKVILPLGISFITFQKIAFLVDVSAGRVTRFTAREYALFVLFFPQLVAGPIVHYREMMPQFAAVSCRYDPENVAVGVSLFFAGLAKKLLLADPMGQLVAPIYLKAQQGGPVTLIDAWIAALGFTLQIYFDFSGYSDMALGLARFFGIKLPVNFNSPLKATCIIDFWLRWHVSLTRFLTAYVYNPMTLAMTRRRMAAGKPVFNPRRATIPLFLMMLAFPTILTMAISGIWHGAGYTYVVWGVLHGVLLSVNHGWRLLRPRFWPDSMQYNRLSTPIGWILTFVSVVFAMAMFRAPTIGAAGSLWYGMIGGHGITVPQALFNRLGAAAGWLTALGVTPAWSSGSLFLEAMARLAILLALALLMPNTLEMLSRYQPALGVRPVALRWAWMPTQRWAIVMGCIAAAGLMSVGELSEFLYWQF